MTSKPKATAEVRFTVDADFLQALQDRLGIDRSTDIARSALTLLDWASNEVKNGRVVVSSDPGGNDVHRLVMPELATKG